MPLRLAFVCLDDVTDVRAWSGIPFYLSQAVAAAGVHLEIISPLRRRIGPGVAASRLLNRAIGRHHVLDLDRRVHRDYARQVAARLETMDVDAVFSVGAIPIAYLQTGLPVVYYGDATFADLHGYYPGFDRVSAANVRDGRSMDAAALSMADAAVFATRWAATTPTSTYGCPPEKVHVVPLAANLAHPPSEADVRSGVAGRLDDECRLLFLGVDWFRKGGDRALALAEALGSAGLATRLTVVGPTRRTVPESALIDYRGFIDKATPDGEREIIRLLSESHFLCLPTRAECQGCVFCEASACGVPSLTCRTGGVSSVVVDGRNGYVFEEDEFVDGATAAVLRTFADLEGAYRRLAMASRQEFDARLNWTASARRLLDVIGAFVR